DVKARPRDHFKAFFKLRQLCEAQKLKSFNCFPIGTSFIPSYMKLDAKLANHHILKSKKPLTDKCHIWSQVVSLNKKAFK
ncbi:hypothetical protein EDC94DRAFT_495008, partial [Helicostylum pulchrum]